VKAFVRNPEAVAALVMAGAAAGGAVMVSAKLAVAGPPVPVAVSVIFDTPCVAVVRSVPEITPVDELTLNPEGRGEALYEGVVTPEDPIVYEKGYPACAVAVVALVIATPEEGAVSAAYKSSIIKSAV
jgi:hypothetical protein